jgi:hypothetical protein
MSRWLGHGESAVLTTTTGLAVTLGKRQGVAEVKATRSRLRRGGWPQLIIDDPGPARKARVVTD